MQLTNNPDSQKSTISHGNFQTSASPNWPPHPNTAWLSPPKHELSLFQSTSSHRLIPHKDNIDTEIVFCDTGRSSHCVISGVSAQMRTHWRFIDQVVNKYRVWRQPLVDQLVIRGLVLQKQPSGQLVGKQINMDPLRLLFCRWSNFRSIRWSRIVYY